MREKNVKRESSDVAEATCVPRPRDRIVASAQDLFHKHGIRGVGVETIAAALSEPRDAIEEIIEPYLIQLGFVQRTPRGRLLTSHAFRHLGLAEPRREGPEPTLFEED